MKTYIFNHFYPQYLVLSTLVPRNSSPTDDNLDNMVSPARLESARDEIATCSRPSASTARTLSITCCCSLGVHREGDWLTFFSQYEPNGLRPELYCLEHCSQSLLGDTPVKIQVVRPQNGTGCGF